MAAVNCGRYRVRVWIRNRALWLYIDDRDQGQEAARGRAVFRAVEEGDSPGWVRAVLSAIVDGEPPEMTLDYCRDNGFTG